MVDKNNLSDLDVSALPNGFTFIFDGTKPIGAVCNINYYQEIYALISKIKYYVGEIEKRRASGEIK